MLTSVSNEISTYLKYYTDFEEIELKVDNWDTSIESTNYDTVVSEDQCAEIIGVLLKIQSTVKFFKANLTEFKKAEVYLRRYENLRERVLTLTSNLILKTIKEAL